MKKLAIGCGVVALLFMVVAGAGIWYVTNKARGYFRQFEALAEIDKDISNTAAFTPPANGELTAEMVRRFAAVQDGMHTRLGKRVEEITARQDEFVRRMQAENRKESSPMETFSIVKDMMGLILQGKKAQVEALNDQHFSLEEYEWVRNHVYAAAGVSVTEINLRKFATAMKDGGQIAQPIAESAGEVPKRNKELVAPLLPRLKDWVPIAVLGL